MTELLYAYGNFSTILLLPFHLPKCKCSDGTTSTVLMIGELLKQAERYYNEGTHPRVISEGFDKAREGVLEVLDSMRVELQAKDRDSLLDIARTSLRTKLYASVADKFTEMCVDALLTIRGKDQAVDLNMVEIMQMKHRLDIDSRLVRGMVLDHGSRHPDMPSELKNCYVLTCNISLEFDKSEVSSGFYYSSAEQREKLVEAERAYTDERVKKVIDLKKQVCDGTDKSFVVINQKGIDPNSLELLARENIIALRRAKRRNMERLTYACGGTAVTSEAELTPDVLGFAGHVYEHVLGEEKYTFVEGLQNPTSCTILIKGPNDHTLQQLKDAVRDGMRAVKNALDDGFVVPGGGAFEIAAEKHLTQVVKSRIDGRAKLGVQAFADALLGIPKILAENCGYDAQDSVIALQDAHANGTCAGLDATTGEPVEPLQHGVADNYLVKRQYLQSSPVIAQQLLLVDEVIRAGKSASGQQHG